ncbi:MAG: PhzF family phenazine biosynthesis protein [Alphaproteobacteria bacterium]|nr:PhzF family phenazine biosynthesis protein [Alphaproteobacteria bacterium]
MKLKMWQVDAFAQRSLEGNPAALVPLESFIATGLMQKIANENNLAETAFFVRTGKGQYDLRWFTPQTEVDLCGHATLASAHLIFTQLDPTLDQVSFATRSGTLSVMRGHDGWNDMSLPADPPTPWANQSFAADLGAAFGVEPPRELYRARYVMAVWDEPQSVARIEGPGKIGALMRAQGMWGLIATARGGGDYDFVSRFFAPDKGVPEDPVTGSAHCCLTPFWARRLGKKELYARQISARGGNLRCTDAGARTILSGPCAIYMEADIFL